MLDGRMIEWLRRNSRSFHLSYNAHTEHQTTIERHLRHRERTGNVLIFADAESHDSYARTASLWELQVTCLDGTERNFVGRELEACLNVARTTLDQPPSTTMVAA